MIEHNTHVSDPEVLALVARGEWAGAEDMARRAVRTRRDHVEAHAQLSSVYYHMGRFDQARSVANAMRRRFRASWLTWHHSGWLCERNDDHKAAVRYYRRALARDPIATASMLGLVRALIELGRRPSDDSEIMRHAHRAMHLTSGAPEPICTLAAVLAERDDARGAVETLRAGAAIHPCSRRIWVTLSELYADELEDPVAAEAAIDEALTRLPGDAALLAHKSRLRADAQDDHAALSLAHRALDADRTSADAWNAASRALANLGRYEAAVDAARRACGLRPSSAELRDDLVTFATCLDDSETAVREAFDLCARFPERVDNHEPVCDALLCAGRHDEALARARTWVRGCPDDADAWANLAWVGLVARAPDAVAEAAARAEERDEDELGWSQVLLYDAVLRRDWEDAADAHDAVCDEDDDECSLGAFAAIIEAGRGDPSLAERLLAGESVDDYRLCHWPGCFNARLVRRERTAPGER